MAFVRAECWGAGSPRGEQRTGPWGCVRLRAEAVGAERDLAELRGKGSSPVHLPTQPVLQPICPGRCAPSGHWHLWGPWAWGTSLGW